MLIRRILLIENKTSRNRLNEEITSPLVRLIGADGKQVGVVPIGEALNAAADAELDLVEIAPEAQPPVCRIMDFGKYQFDQKKQRQQAKKKQKQIEVKEIKFRPGTDEGDYQVKLRNLIRFLQDGDKAKITMRFRGREQVHQNIGLDLLRRIEAELTDYGIVEQPPQSEGRQMIMVFGPKKK